MKRFRWFSLLTVLTMLLTTVAPLAASPDAARNTQHALRTTQYAPQPHPSQRRRQLREQDRRRRLDQQRSGH